MNTIDEESLYKTVFNTAEALFNGGSLNETEKAKLSSWILGRQNRWKGFIFYPSEQERETGIRLFSGEKPRTKFLADNLVELDTLRLLALIQPEEPKVRSIFQEANERLFPLCFANGCVVGECAHASIAFRRYFMAYDPEAAREKNRPTLETLKQRRDGEGRWRGFPFYFTLLWLSELPGDTACDELSYTRNCIDKLANRSLASKKNPVSWKTEEIRKNLLRKALG